MTGVEIAGAVLSLASVALPPFITLAQDWGGKAFDYLISKSKAKNDKELLEKISDLEKKLNDASETEEKQKQQLQEEISTLKKQFLDKIQQNDLEKEKIWQEAAAGQKHLTMPDSELREFTGDLRTIETSFKAVAVVGLSGKGKSSFIRDWLLANGEEGENAPPPSDVVFVVAALCACASID